MTDQTFSVIDGGRVVAMGYQEGVNLAKRAEAGGRPVAVDLEERARIARPNDVAFGTDTFRHITGIEAAKHLGLLRAWVRGEAPVLPAEQVRALQSLPTPADQQARAEFALGQWLVEQGRVEAA